MVNKVADGNTQYSKIKSSSDRRIFYHPGSSRVRSWLLTRAIGSEPQGVGDSHSTRMRVHAPGASLLRPGRL